MIPISSPYIDNKAKKNVLKCLNTNWISSQGEYIVKFEKSLAKIHKVKYCIVTSGCTSALHLAIKSLGIGKGDEVICPDLIACNATVVHLVEPLVCGLFYAELVAILTLLLGQVETVFYLLIEWAS